MTFTSETLPADHKAAIRQLKRELRAQIGDVQVVFNKLSDKIATRVAEINALKNKGESVWPVRANAYFGCILTKDDFAPELITPASPF